MIEKIQELPLGPLAGVGAPPAENLKALREEARGCRSCHLWQAATQTVFGTGPAPSPLMLIGEQPGDKEDIAGLPFVGPAGERLNSALSDAGIDRGQIYVTNAVKHFKFVRRGRIRLHQKPATAEIKACHPWLERELALVRPKLAVAMGATAAQALLGKATPINQSRGQILQREGYKALVTIHPSYLLRITDRAQAANEYDHFVADLRLTVPFLS